MARGICCFSDDLQVGARQMEMRGINVYAQLLAVADSLPDEARAALAEAWAERDFGAPYERYLLFCACLRFAALTDATNPLAAAIGDPGSTAPLWSDEELRTRLARALLEPGVGEALRARFVQTNEVSRAFAWRLALSGVFGARARVILVDLGCSAGLGLIADRLAIEWRDPDGEPLALGAPISLARRIGLDRRPIDVSDPIEARWLEACVWPGQTERVLRLRAAIEQTRWARAAGELELHTVSGEDMPAFLRELSAREPTAHVLASQSVFAEYLGAARPRYETEMRAWVRANASRAAWVEFEAAIEGASEALPASARVTFGDECHPLGRSDWHPSLVHLDARGLEALRAAG